MSIEQIAREGLGLSEAYEKNPHPMGGHGDPVRGPGFDLERHASNHHAALCRAALARGEALREARSFMDSHGHRGGARDGCPDCDIVDRIDAALAQEGATPTPRPQT